MKKIKCELCGYDIDTHQIKKHKSYCNGLGPRRIRKYSGKGKGWEKGKTFAELYGEKRAKEICNKISKKLIGKSTGKASTPEKEEQRKKQISITGKLNPKCGGLRKGSGRGKKGYYKGIWCDSSWELAWVIYNIEHDIKFKRNWEKFEYEYENKIHFYIPDFILENNQYIEIKGRRKIDDLTEKELIKMNAFKEKNNLQILLEKEIKPYIDYAIKKYGNDFIKLYE
jgi:hypothetical protein